MPYYFLSLSVSSAFVPGLGQGGGQGLIEYGGSIHPPSKRRRSKKSHTNSRVSDIVDARTKLRAEQEFITTDHDAAMVGYLASGGDWGVG